MSSEKEEENTDGQLADGAVYDESLEDFLLENKFTFKQMADICPPPDSRVLRIHYTKVASKIQECKDRYKTGCIFTLPGSRRDGMVYLYYSTYTSNEIRRIVAIRAFL